jgi:hypothetical protein
VKGKKVPTTNKQNKEDIHDLPLVQSGWLL